MSKILTIIFTLCTICVFAQKNPTKAAQAIVAEGKLLYKSEMASWHGTDLFIESYKDHDNIGGYFSYSEEDISKCIFFSKAENPEVIGAISFDSTYDISKAKMDLDSRAFTDYEEDLYQIRENAFAELMANEDQLFQFYENTNPNIIPLINGKEKKAYILTGPTQHGVVIFGNDYLLTFDKDNKIKIKKQLHKNIIPIQYGQIENGEKAVGAMHSHTAETGDFITATDVCTLMLYSKFAQWKSHTVVSEKYLNTWDCETNQLTVLPKKTMDKIIKNQEKKKKKNKN